MLDSCAHVQCLWRGRTELIVAESPWPLEHDPVKYANDFSGSAGLPICLIHSVLRSGVSPSQPELTMAGHSSIRLPNQ